MKELNNAWSDLRIYRGLVGHQINGFIVGKSFFASFLKVWEPRAVDPFLAM
jgi:hypothetical protein